MWMAHPKIAKRWAHEYPESNKGLPKHVRDSAANAIAKGYRKKKTK